MEEAAILVMVGLTSVAAWRIGVRRLGLESRGIRAAAGRLLECLGLAACFFAANVVVGVTGVLLTRALTGAFFSLYVVEDVTLVVFSVFPAMVFAWWQAGAAR